MPIIEMKCPRCGAAQVFEQYMDAKPSWDCGSYIRATWEMGESNGCLRRQLRAEKAKKHD